VREKATNWLLFALFAAGMAAGAAVIFVILRMV
jgi:hypothetical protein